jgi:cytochrome c oxidase cbb3-type subunit III
MTRAWSPVALVVSLALSPLGCAGPSDAATLTQQPAQSPPDTLRFVAHTEHIPAGFPSSAKPLVLTNPFEGNANALKVGSQLYISYNCIDCHGADGSGAMAPSLADNRWHFGGSTAEVFESIYQGRPEGMPTWGGRIANDQIWMLVTYVRSLSAGKNVSTENFTGKTVERTGH